MCHEDHLCERDCQEDYGKTYGGKGSQSQAGGSDSAVFVCHVCAGTGSGPDTDGNPGDSGTGGEPGGSARWRLPEWGSGDSAEYRNPGWGSGGSPEYRNPGCGSGNSPGGCTDHTPGRVRELGTGLWQVRGETHGQCHSGRNETVQCLLYGRRGGQSAVPDLRLRL